MTAKLLRIGIGLFLVFPFLTLLFYFDDWSLVETEQILKALKYSVLQSAWSAIFSVALGFLGAMGLNFWRRYSGFIRAIFLFPNLIPPLFVMISAFQIFRPFPFGLTGIVLINTMINAGLCAVVIQSIMEEKIGGWAELAYVEGAGKFQFLFVALKFLKRDLALVAYFVFCVCFSSLTIPLLAGKFDVASLEILIYEKLNLSENFGEIFGLAALQSIFIFLLGVSLPAPNAGRAQQNRKLHLLQWRWGTVPIVVISMVILFEVFITAPKGLDQIQMIGWGIFGAEAAAANSLGLGLLTGLLAFVLCCAICFSLPHRNFEKFVMAYIAPSTALTAFSYYILDLHWPLAVTAAALTGLFLPIVFRLSVASSFRGLTKEIEVAQVLGAGPNQIFWNITLPRCAKTFGIASGLVAFWAIGDFAVSGILMGDQVPMALLSKKLMESYRIEVASFFVLLLLVLGSTLLFAFWSLGYVLSERPLSRLRRL
jgi:thiamine transport system permease protein